jgi:hypothetical protein
MATWSPSKKIVPTSPRDSKLQVDIEIKVKGEDI